MKKATACFAVWCLVLALPMRSYAEEPAPDEQPEAATEAVEVVETPASTPPVEFVAPEDSPFTALLMANTVDYPVDMAAYYLTEMTEAAENGDVSAGRAAEANRRAALEAAGQEDADLSFDDLYLLARLIDAVAGSDWLSDEFRMCVGEVVLNRVASPEFPDTLHEVVYQKGQYSVASTAHFAALKPRKECVAVALRLLEGERRMVPSVVYQADYLQGELFTMYSDWRLGNTYFCLSANLELYD